MKVDTSLIELLGLDPSKTVVGSAGGGGCSSASTSRIISQLEDGSEKTFFVKTGQGDKASIMFRGEDASLKAIHAVVPTLCPRSYGHGKFHSQSSTCFLVTDFLHLSSRSGSKSKPGQSLAAKLARLHTSPAPIPDGFDRPLFGFPVTTCCGDTPQDNTYKGSWAQFYAENRLQAILRQAEKRNGKESEIHELVKRTVSKVVPRLIGDDHLNGGKGVTPVVVHGDLWSGNASAGVIGDSNGDSEDVIFDASACYAHNEFELGIMKMFGGFGQSFLQEYHELCPKTEPTDEYEDRVKLYELYHHLNHYALFGGSYRSGAVNIMKSLIRKYGN